MISTQVYANNASTTLASSVGQSDTNILVSSAAAFPLLSVNEYFRATIDTGTTFEIIFVNGVSGNTFTDVLRGQEGTIAQTFQPGTLVECRTTAGTLRAFARLQDRLFDITSVDTLDSPANSDANSYLCAATDDAGNPIVAVDHSGQTWRFVGHPTVVLTGTALGTSTSTFLAFPSASNTVVLPTPGKFIVQFVSGQNKGLCRMVTNSDSTGIYWTTALSSAPVTGDNFEVYQSTASSLSTLLQSSDDNLVFPIIFSD